MRFFEVCSGAGEVVTVDAEEERIREKFPNCCKCSAFNIFAGSHAVVN